MLFVHMPRAGADLDEGVENEIEKNPIDVVEIRGQLHGGRSTSRISSLAVMTTARSKKKLGA